MTIIVQLGPMATNYWKYGPEPGNNSDHRCEFIYNPATKSGAVINGRTITLHFVDGARGDSDLTANGVISDPGGELQQIALQFSATGVREPRAPLHPSTA